jgi:hypothetical protein
MYHVAADPLDRLARLVGVLVDGGDAPADLPIELVRKHRLGPLAFRHGAAAFRGDFIMASLRAEQQRAIAAEAVAALGAIPVALLKGLSYGGWLYADPGERPMNDVDLLVPIEAHAAAVAALARIGYRRAKPGDEGGPRHHAQTLARGAATVDLHRSPAQLGRIRIDFAGVWRRARPASWVAGAFRLDVVDEILFHFANLARHDLIAPLLTYVDAGRLVRAAGPRWPELLGRARAWRFARVLDRCLEHVEHVLGRRDHSRWWLPPRAETLRGDYPRRSVQIGRKLLLVEGPRELGHLALAVVTQRTFAKR